MAGLEGTARFEGDSTSPTKNMDGVTKIDTLKCGSSWAMEIRGNFAFRSPNCALSEIVTLLRSHSAID